VLDEEPASYKSGCNFSGCWAKYCHSGPRYITAAGVVVSGSTACWDDRDPRAFAYEFPTWTTLNPATGVQVESYGNEVFLNLTPWAGSGWGGPSGSVDGSAQTARFNLPGGLALDAAGNVYVADTDNNTIRKITFSTSQVTTLAGRAGVGGWADGQGAAARFNAPTRVAVDGAGNVFVADTGNKAIRKITPDGRVSTLGCAACASPTPSSIPQAKHLVASVDLTNASARNDLSGWSGFQFVPSSNMTLRQLGRWIVPGNVNPHPLKLVRNNGDGTFTDLAETTLRTLGQPPGGFAYASIPATQLTAGRSYLLLTYETYGGDASMADTSDWGDPGPVPIKMSSAGAATEAVFQTWGSNPTTYQGDGLAGNVSYGPVDAAWGP
jgi:hypothetical protein